MSRFYVTTAIPYANGAPHIGHAYERIATDAIQRFMRLDGRDTLFVTGMDEYGLKVQQTAAREGMTPQAFVDRIAAEFEAMGELLNARADDIVRTTQPRHARSVQEIWRRMAANGDIYLSTYSGWYSVRDEAYFDESELSPGPDATKLAPTGAPVEWVEEESWFFRLSAYADRLLAHYAAHPEFVTPEKYRNELVAFIKRGLSDLSISRTTFGWGVPVPDDPKHVMYVWVDALTNYLTATGFPDEGPRSKFWPADAHVIGKDITRFHAIYWPAFLMSAGLPVPRQIVVHGFLFNRGEKMSKSVARSGRVSPRLVLKAAVRLGGMRPGPIVRWASTFAGEEYRDCRRRRELCSRCCRARTTGRARHRRRTAVRPDKSGWAARPPYSRRSTRPPASSGYYCRPNKEQWGRTGRSALCFLKEKSLPLGHSDDFMRSQAWPSTPVAEKQQVVRGEVQRLRTGITLGEDVLVKEFMQAGEGDAQGGCGLALVIELVLGRSD